MDTVIFAADLIVYAFVGVSLSYMFKLIMRRDLLRFAVVNLVVFAPLFTTLSHLT